MKKTFPLLFIVIFSMIILMAGCGNREQAENNSESGPSTQATIWLESESPVESEISVPEPSALEQPEGSSSSTSSVSQLAEDKTTEETNTEMRMNVQIGSSSFTATLEENAAVDALVEMMENGPVTIQMRDYSGFEKVGPLSRSLPTYDSQTTTYAGDIVLYQGNQIVMFYGSNTWSYTRLGRINDLIGWEEALGSGDVTVTFSLEG